jgi:hypothetical protein
VGITVSNAQRRLTLFVVPAVVTFAGMRAYLWFAPDTDLNVGAYNIHHLYTGLVVATLGGVPLAVLDGAFNPRLLDLARVVFSVGLAMALDEWLYLIVTDGTNASYSLPVSFWGGLAAIALACLYAIALAALGHRRTTT